MSFSHDKTSSLGGTHTRANVETGGSGVLVALGVGVGVTTAVVGAGDWVGVGVGVVQPTSKPTQMTLTNKLRARGMGQSYRRNQTCNLAVEVGDGTGY